MTPTTADPEAAVVRIPADLDRPDRILVASPPGSSPSSPAAGWPPGPW